MRYIPAKEVANCNECFYSKMVTLQMDAHQRWCELTHTKLYYSPTYPEIPDNCPLPREPKK